MSRKYGLETTFNKVAQEYDRLRPCYVPELYADIFSRRKIDENSDVLEIGIGTGQATRPVLETGCRLTAVELGSSLAVQAAANFVRYDTFEIRNEDFLDFRAEKSSFDLIYSASAFHWIPEEQGYNKVFSLLKPGGIFARFANHPFCDKEKPDLHDAMQRWYGIYMPGSKPAPVEYTEEQARNRAKIALRYGFEGIEYKLYRRTRSFTADEYAKLLGTYSDHIALGHGKLSALQEAIKGEIERFGGMITIYDTIDLQIARKPE